VLRYGLQSKHPSSQWAISPTSAAKGNTTKPRTTGVADRLRELESLRNQGLVGEGECESKRKEILDEL